MFLFSQPELIQLIKNGQNTDDTADHYPVAKLFVPGTGRKWLVTEVDYSNPLKGVALSDDGDGKVTYGDVNFEDIIAQAMLIDKKVQRDPYFVGKYPISVYLTAGMALGFITEFDILLGKVPNPGNSNNSGKPPSPT